MSVKKRVQCFCEDVAHENFIKSLIERAAQQKGVQVDIAMQGATHGSRVWNELKAYLDLLGKRRANYPDVLVIVLDSDCKKRSEVKNKVMDLIAKRRLNIPVVCAVPEPHIERWYLEDQRAFREVLPKATPKKLSYRCERDRYKQALREAIRAADIEPLLGGAEYGGDIARALDPKHMDDSFKAFWEELLRAL